jgi:hypothetical protein
VHGARSRMQSPGLGSLGLGLRVWGVGFRD